ncbi:hypothetical protein BDR03DRAFT_987384 [Suillus americanus]|nr:hypothetical protein BDR03DRAFT_987384 [Suillus americanus]
MPATKMTAKKSNGGAAPRVLLRLPGENSSTVPAEDMDVCNGIQHNEYMDVPKQFQLAILAPDITFRKQEGQRHSKPYVGFYKGEVPVLSDFLPILTTLEISPLVETSSATIMFIHLNLVNNDTTGGPFNLAYQFLVPYFPRGGIMYQDMEFDIATVEKATAYQRKVDKLVQDLLKKHPWSRIVIGITNHMDNVTGDPFAGYNGEGYIAGAVDNFLAILLKPWQVLINRTDESYLWFFACGALVNNPTSFAALQQLLEQIEGNQIINMPKNTAKVAKVPKKKVKVGTILSGISRAAASNVAVGSMVNVSKGPSMPLHIEGTPPVQSVQTLAPNVSTPAITTSSPHKHKCVNCGAIVCEQFLPRSSGCIFLRTVEVADKDFQCPMCLRLGDGKDAPLRYAFIGFSRRKKVEMAWPMCIINLNLESMKDDYLARTVTLEAQNHYRTFLANLFTLTLHMRGGAHVSELKKLAPSAEFIVRNMKAGLLPNTFLILDTHSDKYTSMLQHTGGHTGGTSTTIIEILTAYLGNEFMQVLAESSQVARSDKTTIKTISGSEPWCDLSAHARGGWRGVLMPSFRSREGFGGNINAVDFVVGFGGSGTLPLMVASAVQSFVMEIGIFGCTDIWPAVCDMLTLSNDFLDYTTAVVVFANKVGEQRAVECRQIGKDIPGVRAFGYEFKSCPTPGCQPVPADMRVYNHGVKVQLCCLKCKWRSSFVRTDEDNKHFKRVGEQRAVECRQIGKDIPGVRAFGYEFKSCPTPGCQPVPADMRVYNHGVKVQLCCLKCKWRSSFVRTDEDNKHFKRTKGDRGRHASSSQGQGVKCGDKKGKSRRQADISMDMQEDSEMTNDYPDHQSMVLDDSCAAGLTHAVLLKSLYMSIPSSLQM